MRAIVILRHVYGISRQDAARLPKWEKDLLINAGKGIMGVSGASSGAQDSPLDQETLQAILPN